jgi:hypothetical protein
LIHVTAVARRWWHIAGRRCHFHARIVHPISLLITIIVTNIISQDQICHEHATIGICVLDTAFLVRHELLQLLVVWHWWACLILILESLL